MDSDPTWIEDLSKNNYLPSQEQAREIKKLMVEPLKELKDLEGEILDLRNRLSELEIRQIEVKKRIARYEHILSPIRRIPLDVLGEIFYHCLATHRNPIMSTGDYPLLLTRVCSIWRATAMATPKLWDRLYITFTDEDTVPDFESLLEMPHNRRFLDRGRYVLPKAAKEEMVGRLRRRCEGVREWFLRSGTRPLSIWINFTTAAWYEIPYSERELGVTMDFLSLLASLAPRWKTLTVRSSLQLYRVLEDMLPISQMSAFRCLRADFSSQFFHHPEDRGDVDQHLLLLDAPNIRQLSMSARSDSLRILGLTDRSFAQWNKFTHITCFEPLPLDDALFLLQHSSNLVHFQGSISHYRNQMNGPFTGHISLPFLQSLSIKELAFLGTQHMIDIYDSIDAPKLQWITYYARLSGANSYVINNPTIHILPLLQQSTELQYLCVDGKDVNLWDFEIILRAVPSIATLVIGKEGIQDGLSYDQMLAYENRVQTALKRPWSLSRLVVGDNPSNELPLVPRLTTLIISSKTVWVSDDTLFEVICSRMASPQTAVLKRVKGRFFREIERSDIVEELRRRAESVGVEIDVDLEYMTRRSENPTTPYSGMNGLHAPIWYNQNAGEAPSWHSADLPLC